LLIEPDKDEVLCDESLDDRLLSDEWLDSLDKLLDELALDESLLDDELSELLEEIELPLELEPELLELELLPSQQRQPIVR